MLQNAYFLSKIGADTAENEQHFAEILPKIGDRSGERSPPGRDARARERLELPRSDPIREPHKSQEMAWTEAELRLERGKRKFR